MFPNCGNKEGYFPYENAIPLPPPLPHSIKADLLTGICTFNQNISPKGSVCKAKQYIKRPANSDAYIYSIHILLLLNKNIIICRQQLQCHLLSSVDKHSHN